MTISRRRTSKPNLDDDLVKAAIAWGLGLTNEQAAEAADKSVDTVKRYKTDEPVQRLVALVSQVYAMARAQNIAEAVNDATTKAEDRIKRIFDRGLRLTERAVQKVEELGDAATVEDLMAMHKEITVWASKFAASEAPKRMKFEGGIEHKVVSIVGLADASNVIAAMRELKEMHPQAMISAPQESVPDA